MKNYNKKQFFQEVKEEIENIKKHTTIYEKQKLEFSWFHPNSGFDSIYGQLMGSSEFDQAIELIEKCCKRYCKFTFQTQNNSFFKYKEIKKAMCGTEMPSDFVNYNRFAGRNLRNLTSYSLLEAYTKSEYANNENILSYIKGETDKLIL